jgi:DNA polymerase
LSGGARADAIAAARALLSDFAAEGIDVLGPCPARAAVSEPAAAPTPARAWRAAPAHAARPRPAPAEDTLVPPLGPVPTDGPRAQLLAEIRDDLGECTRCRLHERRRHIVFGEGSPDAGVVFVGEGPGADEDRSGRPFVGRAGELLTRMIAAVGWRREDVYICNIVKCRPPENREPELDEIASCRPYLERQLLGIAPRAIVSLGKPATSTLLGRPIAITKARGIWQEWRGIPVMPTFHPAYLLRNYTRETRQAVWDDLRAVRARVDAGSDA